jgi:L-alanine-DL-glutamate epimerase-like enolase superfamily enzyme
MAHVTAVRPVLLTGEYGDPASLENLLHLPTGMRTCGLVELTLSNGVRGLGEGYAAVFAPEVFAAAVELVGPAIVGLPLDGPEDVAGLARRVTACTGYWSHQGPGRHVLAAFETAAQDCLARTAGVPLWRSLGVTGRPALRVYASGGDATGPDAMAAEIEHVAAHGVGTLKIRARGSQVAKAVWSARATAEAGVDLAVDMCQNLAVPSQSADDALAFERAVTEASGRALAFLEEPLGADRVAEYPGLRARAASPVAGGEIVTTPGELAGRMSVGSYDMVQPDTTVVGGIGATLEVFGAARRHGVAPVVHCWGGAVGVYATWCAAAAGGGELVEWPTPAFAVRDALLGDVGVPRHGTVTLGDAPGLGLELTPAVEREFAYRPEATYRPVVDDATAASFDAAWP